MNQKTIKKYSSLALKKYRDKHGLFLVEGNHAVDELLKSAWEIEYLITSNSEKFQKLNSVGRIPNLELVKPAVIDRIATAKTPQEILGVAKIPQISETDLTVYKRIIISDRIKDPGNMGTIIRTARAFGFDAVITTLNSVDIYNPKVVRATQGAMFGIRVLAEFEAKDVVEILKPSHKFYALTPEGNIDIDEIEPDKNSVLIIGTEIEGVSRTLRDHSDFLVRIPHSESVESLNAAVAAGIAMYRFGKKI